MAMDALLRAAERYVGLAYQPGVFDCLDLALQVQREVFGRAVALPAGCSRPGGARGQAREIARWRDALARPLAMPVTGTGVLLWEPDDGGRLWHIGTVFVHGGEVWVLHNSFAMGCVALQRLTDLQRWGLRFEGYYEWL